MSRGGKSEGDSVRKRGGGVGVRSECEEEKAVQWISEDISGFNQPKWFFVHDAFEISCFESGCDDQMASTEKEGTRSLRKTR